MQTPLAVQLRQSPTPVAKGNEPLPSASSPMHNVVPQKRNMERCKPFFVDPKMIHRRHSGSFSVCSMANGQPAAEISFLPKLDRVEIMESLDGHG